MCSTLGARISEVFGSAKKHVVIVAPFIKKDPLERVLKKLTGDLQITCVTRWLPEDIASGICDLDVLAIVQGRDGGRLLIHPHLHAKYYRGDSRCLIGSANLTRRGLGWNVPPNLELLTELSYDSAGLRSWEESLISTAIPATEELRDRIANEAQRLGVGGLLIQTPELGLEQEEEEDSGCWVPTCPLPAIIWDVYSKRDSSNMVLPATREAAVSDLRSLGPPAGLSKFLFEAYVAGIIRQMPLVRAIDDRAERGLSDTEGRRLLGDVVGESSTFGPEDTWEILKAWFTHFLKETYRVETREDFPSQRSTTSRLGKLKLS